MLDILRGDGQKTNNAAELSVGIATKEPIPMFLPRFIFENRALFCKAIESAQRERYLSHLKSTFWPIVTNRYIKTSII